MYYHNLSISFFMTFTTFFDKNLKSIKATLTDDKFIIFINHYNDTMIFLVCLYTNYNSSRPFEAGYKEEYAHLVTSIARPDKSQCVSYLFIPSNLVVSNFLILSQSF